MVLYLRIFCDLSDRTQMISGVRDEADRHPNTILGPLLDVCQTHQRALIRLSHAFAERIPLGVVDGFDQPAVIPVHAFGTAVDELAQAVEIELRVLGLSRDRGAFELRRCLLGRQRVQSVEKSDTSVEERTRLALG